MSYLAFRISYAMEALPAWEASRTLAGFVYLYYHCLLLQDDHYLTRVTEVFRQNGDLLPEDFTAQVVVKAEDRLLLDVWSLSSSLNGKASTQNDTAANNAAEVIQVLKGLKTSTRGQTDEQKLEALKNAQDIREKLVVPLRGRAPQDLQAAIEEYALLACLILLADTIESLEVSLKSDVV